MLAVVLIGTILWFGLGYRIYGACLRKRFALDDRDETPAVTLADGKDYCPCRAPILFGHHFSSIAGAGPIVGPILAGALFGWVPALLWILIGALFVGGVHDFGSLVASIRHRGRSVAEVARETISPAAQKLFLTFIWLALILVLACFIDLTAKTFLAKTPTLDGGSVATSSLLYIALALAFGVLVNRLRVGLVPASLLFVPLVFAGVWVGIEAPIARESVAIGGWDAAQTYVAILIAYCFVASMAPVWVLLQPRDYLSSFLLIACLVGGTVGILFGGLAIEYPAFRSFMSDKGPMFPFLFIFIACGACSGFHSIVASGTTAKQVARETDALRIGFGGMLLEGVLAVMALATVMVLATSANPGAQTPTLVFANGFGRFTSVLGIGAEVGVAFGLLAISTFLLTTLDTCTRLSRFVFEELVGSRTAATRWGGTIITLVLPLALLNITVTDAAGAPMPAYKMIWPLFGATNQLLGGLALLTITMWLRSEGRRAWLTGIPCAFMIGMTVTALIYQGYGVLQQLYAPATAGGATTALWFQVGYCTFLLFLAVFLVAEALRARSRLPRLAPSA